MIKLLSFTYCNFVNKISFIAIIAFSLIISCGKESACLKSTGNIAVEIRELNSFSKLSLSDKINVQLKPSNVNRLTISAGENIIPYIITEVNNDELIIKNDNSCNFLRSYKKSIDIILEYDALVKINYFGAGKVSSVDTIRQPYLEVIAKGSSGDFDLLLDTDSVRFILHTGNTNLYLNGNAATAFFYSGGTSIVKAQNLNTQNCFANNSGSGDFYIHVLDYLYAEIQDQGNIYFSGSPSGIDKTGNGKGELKKM